MKRRLVSILLASAMAVNMVTVPVLGTEVIPTANNINDNTNNIEVINNVNNIIEETEEAAVEEIVVENPDTGVISNEVTPSDDNLTSSEAANETQELQPSQDNTEPAQEISLDDSAKSKLDSLFPGLPEDYVLTEEQIEDKKVLKEHVAESVSIDPEKLAGITSDSGTTPATGITSAPSLAATDLTALTDDPSTYVPGELVYMADTEEEAETIAKAFNAKIASYDYGVLVLELPEGVTTAQAVVAAAEENINLPAVWPNFYSYLDETGINDPNFYTQLENSISATDPYLSPFSSSYQYMHEFVGSEKAWAAGYTGKGVRVAVIDTGCIDTHTDIKNNIIPGTDITTNKTSNVDSVGHGTFVTGVIAAEANGSLGVGIAPEARVKCFKVTENTKSSAADADIARGINAAVSEGFDIINISLGSNSYDATLEAACQNAYNAGVAVFCSAGNEAFSGLHYPSSYSSTICVGALDKSGAMADFSNYGSNIDLSFPGVKIYSLRNDNNTEYTWKSGTSFSTPIASGVAAVILSKMQGGRSKARVDSLVATMKSAAKSSSSDGMGAGYTYLPKALGISGQEEPAETIDAPTVTADAVCQKGNVYEAESVTLTLKIPYTASQTFVYTLDGTDPKLTNGNLTNGYSLTGTVEDEYYTAKLVVSNKASTTVKVATFNATKGELSKIITKQINLHPFATDIDVYPAGQSNKVRRNGTITLKAKFTPSYTYDKSVKWTLSDDAKDEGIRIEKYTGKITIGAKTEEGTYVVTATAKDSSGSYYGPTKDYEIEVTTESAYVKTITTKKTSKNINIDTATVSLEEYIRINGKSIETGDVVWTSSKTSIATVDPSTGIITPVKPGETKIKAMATDGTRKSVSITVKIIRHAESITVTGPTTVIAGRSSKFKASVLPADTTYKTVKWTCDAPKKYITVLNGVITVSSKCPENTYRITATDKYGTEGHADFTVSKGYITSVKFDESETTLFTNGSQTSKTLKVTVNGKKDYDEKAIKFYSSNERVATVDALTGLVTARSIGNATITCKSTDGTSKSSTHKVNVYAPVTNIAISPVLDGGFKSSADISYILIAKGGSRKLTARATSAYGKIATSNVEWSVNDTSGMVSIASDGTLTASSTATVGLTTVITATAKDGSLCKSTVSVKVVDKFEGAVIKVYKVGDATKGYAVFSSSSATSPLTYASYTVTGDSKATLQFNSSYNCYYPIAASPTTNLSSSSVPTTNNEKVAFIKKNGVECTVIAKLMDGSGVTAPKKFYVCKTSDGKNYYSTE